MAKLIDELRPAEALYILSYAGKEDLVEEKLLAAALAYLGTQGYLAPTGEGFTLAKPDFREDENLRKYESRLLQCFEENRESELPEVMKGCNLRKRLVKQGFLERKKVETGFWIFSLREKEYSTTGKFDQAVQELESLRQEIKTAQEQGTSLTGEQAMMAYAFPSILETDEFESYVQSSPHRKMTNSVRNIFALNCVFF